MNFTERIISTITKPDKAMADIAKEPRFEEALVIVAAYAIFGAIIGYISATHITTVFVDSAPPISKELMSTLNVISGIIGGLVRPFLAWIIVTVVLYLFSMVLGGESKFTTVLSALGYSNLPKIAAAILAILLLSQAPHVTVEVSSSNPWGSISSAGGTSSNPYMFISNIVMLLGVLWSSYIGLYGIKHTEKLSLKSAAIVVGVPLAIYVILYLFGNILLRLFI